MNARELFEKLAQLRDLDRSIGDFPVEVHPGDGPVSDVEVRLGERKILAIVLSKAEPTVPIADVAHVIRNALVPTLIRLGSNVDKSPELRAALTGIATALDYVDGLVKRALAEG